MLKVFNGFNFFFFQAGIFAIIVNEAQILRTMVN
jgi:hypothetical protein